MTVGWREVGGNCGNLNVEKGGTLKAWRGGKWKTRSYQAFGIIILQRRENSFNKYVPTLNSAQETFGEVNLPKTVQIPGDKAGTWT